MAPTTAMIFRSVALLGVVAVAEEEGSAQTCAAGDAACMASADDDASDMKTSLLQVKTKKLDELKAADSSNKEADEKRRAALLEELDSIDSELKVHELEEHKAKLLEELEAIEDAMDKEENDYVPDDYGYGSSLAQAMETFEQSKEGWKWGTGNCASYKCGDSFRRGRNCQCNSDCEKYGSCCEDYATLCAEGKEIKKPGCANYGCGTFLRGRSCQCNDQCAKFGSCCEDYEAACKKDATPRPTPAPEPETEAPSPSPEPAGSSVKGVYGHPSSKIDYPKYEGFTLYLAEEFDEPIDVENDKIWTWSDGGLREGEVRFVKEQIKFEGGVMKLEISNVKPFPKTEPCSAAAVEVVGKKPLVSGELRSRHNIFRYGRYEARIKAPEVQPGKPEVNGNFIATMFVYRDANAHHWREIDFEITGDAPNSLMTNQLSADGTKNWRPELADTLMPDLGTTHVRKNFNVYMFEWIPAGVTWYVNGKVIRKGSRLPVPELSTKVMMNVWIFSGYAFGGPQGHNNQYPFHAEYDYFRFYKWDQEDTYPCEGFSTDCLTKDDKYLAKNNPCDGIEQVGLLEGSKPCVPECRK